MVDNSTEVEKMPPLPAIKFVAVEKIINPFSPTNSKTSPQPTLASGGVKDANIILNMIEICKINEPMLTAATNLPLSFSSDKPNEQYQVVSKNAPTSSVPVQQSQQQRKSMPNDMMTKSDDLLHHQCLAALLRVEMTKINVRSGRGESMEGSPNEDCVVNITMMMIHQ